MKPSGGENNAIVILTKTAYRLRKTLNMNFLEKYGNCEVKN